MTKYPVLKSREEALEATRALLPAIAKRAAEADRSRLVPAETIAELERAGLFGVLTPRGYGGSALGWGTFLSIVMELGKACGSTAWVYGVLTGHNHMLTRFPERVQQRLLGDPQEHIAVVFRLTNPWSATPVDGGYVLKGGQGRFCSGVDYARWVGVNAIIDGGPDAGQLAFCMIEQPRMPKLDDWHTVGMRGTASKSILVEDLFVAREMTALGANLAGPPVGPAASEATFYSWSYLAIAPFAIVGAPLGVALGALDAGVAGVKARLRGLDAELTSNMSPTFVRLSHAAQQIESAIALIMRDVDLVDTVPIMNASPLDIARFRRDLAAAPQLARYAVTSLFESSGGSGVYERGDLQRMLRDVNAGAAHYAFVDDIAAMNYGRAMLDLPPARSNAFV